MVIYLEAFAKAQQESHKKKTRNILRTSDLKRIQSPNNGQHLENLNKKSFIE